MSTHSFILQLHTTSTYRVSDSPPRSVVLPQLPKLPTSVKNLQTSSPVKPTPATPKDVAASLARNILDDIVNNLPIPSDKYPADTANFKKTVGGTETSSRQLYARLAHYGLDVVQLPARAHPGDCLFQAILFSIQHPKWYLVAHMRLQVVRFLVKHVDLVYKRLEPSLISKGISFYTLCKRILIPGEWGGLETLLFLRWGWKVKCTVISPGHDNALFHPYSVHNCQLLLAYNGVNHYMPVGKFTYCFPETIESVYFDFIYTF